MGDGFRMTYFPVVQKLRGLLGANGETKLLSP